MELSLQRYNGTQALARAILRLISWRVNVTLPKPRKYVLIGAPHTSGWDLFYTILLELATGIKIHWVGKDSLFKWPLGIFMRWLGGIPVDRRSRNNFVGQIVEMFHQHQDLVIAVAPEGSRGKTEYWKTGFYYIAIGAGVPIALGYVDYLEKVVGIGPVIMPSGDIHADFSLIKEFYMGKKGKHPHRQGEIQIRPENSTTTSTD